MLGAWGPASSWQLSLSAFEPLGSEDHELGRRGEVPIRRARLEVAQIRRQERQAWLDLDPRAVPSQQSLHGGAPLSDTGPGTLISAFVLAGAGLWTIWKAKKMEGRSR